MDPVIRKAEGSKNPVLGPSDGVPNYVMLYVQHPPGGSSPHHTHAWEHQAFPRQQIDDHATSRNNRM